MVKGEDSEGHEFESLRWMDIFHINLLFVCLKRPKINEKEAEDGPVNKHMNQPELATVCSVG